MSTLCLQVVAMQGKYCCAIAMPFENESLGNVLDNLLVIILSGCELVQYYLSK